MVMTAECKIISVAELFDDNKYKLNIPDYQRQYKWTGKNVRELIDDIEDAIKKSKTIPSKIEPGNQNEKFKYRIGTIILHNSKEQSKLDIVDGQQRIITLALIRHCLNYKWDDFLTGTKESAKHLYNDAVSRKNVYENYYSIKQRIATSDCKEEYQDAMKCILEVVVITVSDIYEAFQLFDSQNWRGKALNPHDLLKAYHLREMDKTGETAYEKNLIVKKWEAVPDKEIQSLFNDYLFPILMWNRGESMQRFRKRRNFSADDIDFYKGISARETYTYAKKTNAARPYFQITEPFISGRDFFEMVHHYIELKKEIEDTIPIEQYLQKAIESNDHRIGYVTNLFYCALLRYYDKFHNFEPRAVKKLFVWAFALRAAMDTVRTSSINKYALGETDDKKLSQIPVFSLIANARLHSEISNMTVKLSSKEKWHELNKILENILDGKEVKNETKGVGTTHGRSAADPFATH